MNLGMFPTSLHEVAARSQTWSQFGLEFREFLHAFRRARKAGQPLPPMLSEPPRRLTATFPEGNICDAFLAAAADHLSRTNGIETPSWALRDEFRLEQPWFSEPFLEVRTRLLRDTPSAFKDKNLFVFESALQVA